jgi:hypothetical protein
VSIVKPASASTIAEPTTGGVEFSGPVSEAATVTISINGGAAINALVTGTTTKTWKVLTTTGLVARANTVTVTATDADGNTTTSAPRSFNYVIKRTLAITSNNGSYMVSPALALGKAVVGQVYTITAKANTAFFFSSFTGAGTPATVLTPGVTPNVASFTFLEGNTVTINFVASDFVSGVAGLYNGAVQGNTVSTDTQANAGLFTATVVVNTGAFSGKLTLDGVAVPVAGVFNNVTKQFTSPTVANGMVFDLFLDIANAKITGTVTKRKRGADAGVIAVSAPQGNTTFTGGPYYVAFTAPATPAELLDDEYPHGNGHATITIGLKGVATVKGTLADGTVYTSVATVTKAAAPFEVPVFASFTSRVGSLVGKATITNTGASTVTGTSFRWFRSANASQYYPYGYAYGADTGLTVDIAAGNTVSSGALGANVTFSEGGFVSPVTVTVAAAKVVLDATKRTVKGEYTNGAGKQIIGGINVGSAFYGYILSPLPLHTDGSGQGGLVTITP